MVLIMRTGDYSGVSFGFLMFGLVRTYFEYELQNDYDSWRDFVQYAPFLAFSCVTVFYWLKNGFANGAAVQTYKNSEKQESHALPEFQWSNIVYIFMLLGIFAFCLWLNQSEPDTISIMVFAFIPMLRGAQYLSQIIHILYRGHLRGVSLLSVMLMLLAPYLEAVSIFNYMYSHDKTVELIITLLYHDIPSILINSLTVNYIR